LRLRDARGGIATQAVTLIGTSRARAFKKIEERIVKHSLDVIILKALKDKALNGYLVTSLIKRRYDVNLSPGTVYSLLYSLERKGLVEGSLEGKTRYYNLTVRGKETLGTISAMQNRIKAITSSIY
jgi:DNA-binding PadR family transcriptional regulator